MLRQTNHHQFVMIDIVYKTYDYQVTLIDQDDCGQSNRLRRITMQLKIAFEPTQTAPLSSREWQILSLVAQEYSNLQIAQELVISSNTVKVHLRNIFEKLEVQTRLGAVMLALHQGWLRLV